MPIPDFLIVGAPKCGTTALHAFLAEHPALCVPKKEYHHFGRDLRPPDYGGERWDRARYEALFANARPGQLSGESSVWYLYSETAAREIHARNPACRIVIMLRNPVDAMYSLHNMFVWVRDLTPNGVIERETGRVLSFEEALDTQEARKAQLARDGDPEATAGRRTLRLFHTDVATFGPQVARYLDAFPREQVHVVLQDDLRADPEATYRGVLRFLGVDEHFTPAFRQVNGSRDIKSVALHRLMNDHDSLPALRRLMRGVVPQALRKRAFRLIERRNVQARPLEPMREDTRRRLEAHFRPDVERLSALLGRDLVALWYPTARAAGPATVAT
jgi:hypothetical protein